jgi:hypothetical protein
MAFSMVRAVAWSGIFMLATGGSALAQSSNDENQRSTSGQSEQGTTSQANSDGSNPQNQSDQQSDRQLRREQRQTRQDSQDANEQTRREARQERRQERGGIFSNRQPAVGVTVVERGGMGVRVTRVAPNSPAAQAGIKPGDTILEVNGNSVQSPQQLVSQVGETEPGQTAEFAVLRGGREIALQVRVSTREQALTREQREGEGLFGREPRESGLLGQNLRQGEFQPGQQSQYGQQGEYSRQPQYGQTSQYGQQGQWDQRPGQYGQQYSQQYGPGQPWQQGQQAQWEQRPGQSPQYGGQYQGSSSQQYSSSQPGSSRQQGQNYGSPSDWPRDEQGRQIGDRVSQRLQTFEARLERMEQLARRLEQLLQSREGSSARSATYEEESQRDWAERQSSGTAGSSTGRSEE